MLRLGRALQRAPVRVVRARGYHENIIDHYENPRNVGSLDKSDPAVGTVSVDASGASGVATPSLPLDRPRRAPGTRRRARVRRRDEAADQSRRRRQHHRDEVQDLRLRFGDRIELGRDRVAQGEEHRGRPEHQEHGHRLPFETAPCEAALQVRSCPSSLVSRRAHVCVRCTRDPAARSMLAEDAIKAAISDYQKKQATGRTEASA